jgi:hypothetical protein
VNALKTRSSQPLLRLMNTSAGMGCAGSAN